MTTKTFIDVQKPSGLLQNYYVWSLAANWSPSGLPSNGDSVVETAAVAGDAQVDDIAILSLAALTLSATATFSETLYIDTTLTIGMLTLAGVGANKPVLEATNTGGANPTLTINGFSAGSTGTLLSYGGTSIIHDNAPTDPGGLVYQTANSGTIAFAGALASSSKLQFLDALNDTFAFANPGATIAAAVTGLAAGDSLELPGTVVNAVTLGASSLSVATDKGTYAFSNVQFSGSLPYWWGEADSATGLEIVHFDSAPDSFLSTEALTFGLYMWSDPYNWGNHLVPNSGDVSIEKPFQSGYYNYFLDTPLHLDNLNVGFANFNGFEGHFYPIQLFVEANVTIDQLVQERSSAPLEIAVNPHDNGVASATLTLDGPLTLNADVHYLNLIEAVGVGATVVVDTTLAYFGTEVVFSATKGGTVDFEAQVGSGLAIETDSALGNKVIFRSPGATDGNLFEISQNLQVELPGTKLEGLTFTASAMTVTTDLGSFAFSNISYVSSVKGAKASYDAARGLLDLTLQATTDAVSVVASGSGISGGSGAVYANLALTLTVNMSSATTVAGVGVMAPQLLLNDGGVATYSGGSGTSALTFAYTPSFGQNVAALAVTGFNANGATFNDAGALPVDMTGVVGALTGVVEVDTSPPVLAITSPAAFTSIGPTGATISLGGATSDNFGVTAVNLYNILTLISTTTPNAQGGWSLSTTLAAGEYTGLKMRAFDAAGNLATNFLGGADSDVRVASNLTTSYGASKAQTLVGNDDAITAVSGDSLWAWGANDAVTGSGLTLGLYATGAAPDAVTGSGDNISLSQAQANVFGGGDTILYASGGGEAASLVGTGGVWDTVEAAAGITGVTYLTNALAQVFGGGETVQFLAGGADAAHLINTGAAWDIVNAATGKSGTVYLDSASSQVWGGGDTVYFWGGSANSAQLVNTGGAWDTIYAANGASGALYLSSALAQVIGGGETLYFWSGSDAVNIANSGGVWDTLAGENGVAGLTYLTNGGLAQIYGGGETVDFHAGAGNAAHLLNTATAWDVVVADGATTGTTYLDNAWAQIYGGGEAVQFFNGAANAADLINTGPTADTVTSAGGASGVVYLSSAAATISGGGDMVDFWSGAANTASLSGANYAVFANLASFGLDTVSGFAASDTLYFAAADQGHLSVTQSSGNTQIALDANDVVTLTNYLGAVSIAYHA